MAVSGPGISSHPRPSRRTDRCEPTPHSVNRTKYAWLPDRVHAPSCLVGDRLVVCAHGYDGEVEELPGRALILLGAEVLNVVVAAYRVHLLRLERDRGRASVCVPCAREH